MKGTPYYLHAIKLARKNPGHPSEKYRFALTCPIDIYCT
jgi:hypothetical protein